MNNITPPAIVREADSEASCIARAKQLITNANWELGELAHDWCRQWARGRTDTDFAGLVGHELTGDKIYKCRRVFEVFGASDFVPKLSWTHYYTALAWDDADDVLEWAVEQEASVAEMKAWRRALHGEDLTAEEAQKNRIDAEVTSRKDGSPFREKTKDLPTPERTGSGGLADQGQTRIRPDQRDDKSVESTQSVSKPAESVPSATPGPANVERSDEADTGGSGTQAAPPTDGEDRPDHRSDREIVNDANDLARRFYASQGYQVPEGYCFDQATHPQERGCWDLAVIAYEFIEGTPVQDVLDSLEEE